MAGFDAIFCEAFESSQSCWCTCQSIARGGTEPLLPSAFDSIQDAKLALHVWALTAHAQEVLPAQDGFLWTHGTYQFHTLTTEHGEVPPLEGWARMWTDPSDNEVRPSAILL